MAKSIRGTEVQLRLGKDGERSDQLAEIIDSIGPKTYMGIFGRSNTLVSGICKNRLRSIGSLDLAIPFKKGGACLIFFFFFRPNPWLSSAGAAGA